MVNPIPMPMATRLTISVTRFANPRGHERQEQLDGGRGGKPEGQDRLHAEPIDELARYRGSHAANAARTITT